ncbi:hypothetical protein COL26b_007366 [Colletotrichum chrysophilum]|uniref:uncharacterized protein n=1 Tax=Colletotrichum chrysophilum TaxID=1836956 RepID=UPI002300B77F|nr:uncharacterized protein COL26b_007366 [Colletotrichum chrysophilum]KAJ0374451.1 hypothetical protein COL26b_007366 [Colletotrichum chrysophilum]
MPEQNPMQPTAGSSSPTVSKSTILMSGLLVDVYGLEELAPLRPTAVSVLWLYHGRGRAKEDMGAFASRIVSQHNAAATFSPATKRGLIAVAFDQRNHGSRLVSDKANESWRGGNERHAVDMYAMVAGMVSDTSGLMDVVEGYLKSELGGGAGAGEWRVDQHVALGRSKLATFSAEDAGASFLGSRDFPPDLVAACLRHDPKGILFGTGPVPTSAVAEAAEQQRLRGLLDARVRGKKFLVCSGGDDKLVPYSMAKPFVDFFQEATRTWYADGGVVFENIVYEGVGHAFSEGMIEHSCRFLLDVVNGAAEKGAESRSKI